MMWLPLGWLALQILLFVVLLALSVLYFDRRYKRNSSKHDERKPSPGFTITNELFIDPRDGHRYRVYYDPRTGEREYVRED